MEVMLIYGGASRMMNHKALFCHFIESICITEIIKTSINGSL